jgi:hypothetical protein
LRLGLLLARLDEDFDDQAIAAPDVSNIPDSMSRSLTNTSGA